MFQRSALRKRIGVAFAASALLALAACGGSGDDADAKADGGEKTVTLRFSYFTSENNPIGQTWKAWMEDVTERSGGTIKFEQFWDGTLLTGDAVIDGLKDGRADIAQITPTFYAGKFPLTAVNELPFGTNNMGAIGAAMANLVEDNEALAKEWSGQGLKPLSWVVGGPSGIVSNKEITTAADFKGLKIRGMDRGSRALKTAGANVMAIAPNDLYSSMERGLLDATYGVQFGALTSLKLQEVSKYAVDASTGAQTASALAMSEAGWNKLSDAQKKVIEEASAEIPTVYTQKNIEAEELACTEFKKAGVELSVMDAAEVAKLREAGEASVVTEWEKEVKNAGQDPAAFRAEYQAAVEAAAADFPDGEVTGIARCLSAK
jgi:TRAP-type C4-dicarboxylate transport system substrate-binding protein